MVSEMGAPLHEGGVQAVGVDGLGLLLVLGEEPGAGSVLFLRISGGMQGCWGLAGLTWVQCSAGERAHERPRSRW